MSPWGFPTPSGLVPYFQDEDAAVLARVGTHDKNVFLINGNGWIQYGDTFSEYASFPAFHALCLTKRLVTSTYAAIRTQRRTGTQRSPTM
jgi:hypothetical protein